MAEAHKHPNYVTIWVWLAGLTIAELGIAFLDWPKQLLIFILIGLALWKALLVALFYMHLRFEGNRMRIFAIAPLPLTIIVVVAVLTEYVW